MGVDLSAVDFLLRFRDAGLGRTLCLGRQGLHLPRGSAVHALANELLISRAGATMADIEAPDGYTEKFFRFLGCSSVSAMDLSDFEGADLIHDLNEPVPPSLENAFDFIFDGGTLEHVYNFPVASTNVRRMLRMGGLLISINAANNQLGHGLYQFSPELLWRVFGPDAGFEVQAMQFVPITGEMPRPIAIPVPDGQRREYRPTQFGIYIMCAARKRAEAGQGAAFYQGDYVSAWSQARRGERASVVVSSATL